MKALIVQNHPADPLGLLAPFFKQRKVDFEVVFGPKQMLSGHSFDFLVVLGGPPNAHDSLGYLEEEKKLIKQANSEGKKVLGICLGAQLASVAFGGSSKPLMKGEVGMTHFNVLDNWFFRGVKPFFFESHNDWITPPKGAKVLAESTGVQAFSFENVIGIQFHAEATPASAKKMLLRRPKWQWHTNALGKQRNWIKNQETEMRENAFALFDNVFFPGVRH